MEPVTATLGACFHTSASREHPHGITKSRNEINADEIKAGQLDARKKSSLPSEKVGYPEKDTRWVGKQSNLMRFFALLNLCIYLGLYRRPIVQGQGASVPLKFC